MEKLTWEGTGIEREDIERGIGSRRAVLERKGPAVI